MAPRYWLGIIGVGAGFGTGYTATRMALEVAVPPFLVVAVRFLIAGSLMLAYLGVVDRVLLKRSAWLHGSLLGILYVATPTLFFTAAFEYVSAGFGGILIALIPLTTALFAHFMLYGDPLSSGKILGLGLGLLGMASMLLAGDAGIPQGGRPVLGGVLIMGGVLAASLGYIYAKRFVRYRSIRELALPQFAIAAVVAWLIAGLTGQVSEAPRLVFAWPPVLYLGVASTFLTFVLILWMITHIKVTQTFLFEYLAPLFGVLTGAAVLRERVTTNIVLGGVLILGGVIVAQRQRPLVTAGGLTPIVDDANEGSPKGSSGGERQVQ